MRGLPKVETVHTTLDILGLPDPNGGKQEEDPLEAPKKAEEVKEEIAKKRFRDLFQDGNPLSIMQTGACSFCYARG
jgi:hypothetical protein